MIPNKIYRKLLKDKEWTPIIVKRYIKFKLPKAQYRIILGFEEISFQSDFLERCVCPSCGFPHPYHVKAHGCGTDKTT